MLLYLPSLFGSWTFHLCTGFHSEKLLHHFLCTRSKLHDNSQTCKNICRKSKKIQGNTLHNNFFVIFHSLFFINMTYKYVNDLLLSVEVVGWDLLSNSENQVTHVYVKIALLMSNFNLVELWTAYHLYLYRYPSQPSNTPI